MIDTWSTVLRGSFQDIWAGVIKFLPNLFIAIVILVIGWAIGGLLGRVVAQIVKALKVDSILRGAKIEDVLKRAGFNLNSGAFVGGLVEWFVIVSFLVASFEVLGLTQVNIFLQQVVLQYLPQVIAAAFILLVAVVIADASQKLVVGATQAAGFKSANFIGACVKWAIWIFAVLMALVQVGIATQFIQILFTGVVVALALGFGLSFGLGGQDAASKFIDKLKQEIAERR
ncbi:MAG: hypothetical protein WCT19_03805 [Candidatus Paceibacterota bacterium]|jgi:hypothetical protein